MDKIYIGAYILAGIFGAIMIYCTVRQILSKFDHSKWAKDANPSIDAQIVDIKSKLVRYFRNDAKYRTTVKFSDGFIFVTHKTERAEGFVRYSVSVDRSFLEHVILVAAKEAHEKAVSKKLLKSK